MNVEYVFMNVHVLDIFCSTAEVKDLVFSRKGAVSTSPGEVLTFTPYRSCHSQVDLKYGESNQSKASVCFMS